MGENEDMGWFPRYIGGQPMCNDVGCITQVLNDSQMPSAKAYTQVDTTSDAKFLTPPNCDALKRVVDEMKEKIFADLSIKSHKAHKHYKPKFTL